VHEADFRADVVFATQEVEAQSAAACEIDAGGSFGDFGIGEESAAANFEIRDHAAVCLQRPFEREWIYAEAVGNIRFLNNQEGGYGVHGIFQAATEETGSVRRGEDQAVTEACVPNAIAGLGAIDPVPSAGPNLQFVSALDGAGLRANCGRMQEYSKGEGRQDLLNAVSPSGSLIPATCILVAEKI